MKNYKSLKHFTEAMQHPEHDHSEQKNANRQRDQNHHEKPETELSFKKVIQFFKGIKP